MKTFLFLMYFVGLHTQLALTIRPGMPLPFALCALASLLSLPLIRRQLPQLKSRESWPILGYIAVSVMITALAAQSGNAFKALTGSIQLLYSIGIATCLYFLLRQMSRNQLAKICACLLIIIPTLGVLESSTSLKQVSDRARLAIAAVGNYKERYLEGTMDDARASQQLEIMIHGAVRARVFATESAHAASSFFLISMVYLWTVKQTRLALLLWATASAAAMWSIRSPILIGDVICGLLTFHARRFEVDLRGLRSRRGFANTLLAMILAGAFVFLAANIYMMRARSIAEGEGSFIMRLSGPLAFALAFLPQHPLIGVGVVGDLDSLSWEIAHVYSGVGMLVPRDDFIGKYVSNCLGIHFAYFGIVGGLLTLALLLRAVHVPNRAKFLVLLLQLLLLWMTMGGYISGNMWCPCATLLAAVRMSGMKITEPPRRSPQILTRGGGLGSKLSCTESFRQHPARVGVGSFGTRPLA